MRFDVLTLFPGMFSEVLNTSILKRAQTSGQLEVHLHDIRNSTTDTHKSVDDSPYGGGAGMLLRVDVIDRSLKAVRCIPEVDASKRRLIVMMTPQGTSYTQRIAADLASYDQITLLCGHYEGFDERIRSLVDTQISIGDFVLTGGELPAMLIIDSVARLLPGVIHHDGPEQESFTLTDADGSPLLEYPHYTRPLTYNGEDVPDVLRSGNHAEIARWRLEQSKLRTYGHL